MCMIVWEVQNLDKLLAKKEALPALHVLNIFSESLYMPVT